VSAYWMPWDDAKSEHGEVTGVRLGSEVTGVRPLQVAEIWQHLAGTYTIKTLRVCFDYQI